MTKSYEDILAATAETQPAGGLLTDPKPAAKRPFASFLGPLMPIDLTPNAAELARRTAEGSRFTTKRTATFDEVPGFHLPLQGADNWCWAAVAVALQKYLELDTGYTQCALAQRVHHTVMDCCARPVHPDCNRVAYMSDVLAALQVKRLSSPRQPTSPIDGSEIRNDIGRNKPIICLMQRRDNGLRHFMVIVGVDRADGEDWVGFDDPGTGLRYWRPLRVFKDGFKGWFWKQTTRLA